MVLYVLIAAGVVAAALVVWKLVSGDKKVPSPTVVPGPRVDGPPPDPVQVDRNGNPVPPPDAPPAR